MSVRRSRFAGLVLTAGLGFGLAAGCITMPLPGPPPYRVILGAGFDPVIHHRLLLLPIAGLDADPVAEAMVSNALYNELRTVGPFEVLKAPPVPRPVCEPTPPPLPTEDQIAQLISLHRPDALVFVTVTSYSPYPPLEIGLSVRVVSAIDRQTLASLDTTRYAEQDVPFSNGDCAVAHPAEDLLTTDAAIAHSSPREFVRYVSMHVAHALALDPLPLPPTATGLGLSILPKPRPSPGSCEHSPKTPAGPQ